MSTSLCTVRPIATARLVVTAIISLWVIAVPAPASASPGTMTITGDYSLDSGDLFVELAGLGAGTGYDQLIVTGDVSLAGDLTLDVGFTPGLGDTFTTIDNRGSTPVSGAFAQGAVISGGGFDFGITYGGGDGNDVVLTVLTFSSATPPLPSPGTMTVTGNYSLDSGDLFIELAGLGAGTEYDQLIVTGDVSLAGDLTLDVGFTPGLGDTFTIIDNQGANAISGAFTQGSTIFAGGHTFGITYGGGDGNDVVLVVRDVPEPATALLVALGVLFVAGGRRLAAVQRRHG